MDARKRYDRDVNRGIEVIKKNFQIDDIKKVQMPETMIELTALKIKTKLM